MHTKQKIAHTNTFVAIVAPKLGGAEMPANIVIEFYLQVVQGRRFEPGRRLGYQLKKGMARIASR